MQYREQRELLDRKLRRKYKKLKQDSKKIMIEQSNDAEKLKLRIHELQSMLQQRESIDRKNNMQ